MQIQQLRYFLAVADVRHFTRASAELGVAQATLSKQVSALEHDLGAPLLRRARGNITLTPAGEALLPLARRILADVDTARREVEDLTGLRRGRVRIGATPSLLSSLLADALARFHQDFPGIELSVTQGGSRDLMGDLASGELDFALIVLPLQEGDPSLQIVPLLSEELMVATSVARPLPLWHGEVRVTDLRTRPLVMFRKGYELRDATIATWRRAGLEPRFAIEGGEMDAVLRFVEPPGGVIAVDLGGTRCHGALADLAGGVVTEDFRPAAEGSEAVGALLHHLEMAPVCAALPPPLPRAPPRFARVTKVVTATSANFSFVQPYRGGDVVARRNTVIAVDGTTEIRTPHNDCLLVMPSLRPSRGHTAVRLARFVD